MKLKVTTKGEVNIIKIMGPIKAGNEYQIAEKMEEYLVPGEAPKFIIDLAKVTFMNSSALGILLNIYKHIDAMNGRMVFAGLSPEVENLMQITKLTTVFEIYNSTEEALESFNF